MDRIDPSDGLGELISSIRDQAAECLFRKDPPHIATAAMFVLSAVKTNIEKEGIEG